MWKISALQASRFGGKMFQNSRILLFLFNLIFLVVRAGQKDCPKTGNYDSRVYRTLVNRWFALFPLVLRDCCIIWGVKSSQLFNYDSIIVKYIRVEPILIIHVPFNRHFQATMGNVELKIHCYKANVMQGLVKTSAVGTGYSDRHRWQFPLGFFYT